MIQTVVKRDGRIVGFNEQKIKAAIRKAMLTAKTAKGMAEHCCLEYRRLAQILPVLYEQYAQ